MHSVSFITQGDTAMGCIWWLVITAVFSLWPSIVGSICMYPSPGQCVTNNSKHFGDREVLTLDRLSCSFRGSLCSFRQGCRDGNMSPWAVGDGFARARQRASEGTCAAFSYSVLESPWINFTIPVCLHFSFSRYLPEALAVFLASRTSSDAVTALLQEDDNEFLDGQEQTESFTIPQLVGKVLFRMYGGGERPDGFFFKLSPVTFEEGRCETSACSFADSEDPLCGWTAVDWTRNPGNAFARVTSPGRVATLTSPLTRATGESRRDCLEFEFSLQQSGDALNVTVDTDGDSFLLWSLEASTDNDEGWRRDARVQIVTVKAYQIVLRGQRHRSPGGVKVTNIQVTTQGSSGSCQTQPPSAAVNVTLPLRLTTPDLLGSTTPDLLGSTTPDLAGFQDRTVIGGTIGAVIVVLVVVAILVGIVCHRRRRERKSGRRSVDMVAASNQNGNDAVDVLSPSYYDTVGGMSPPNVYNSLQAEDAEYATTPSNYEAVGERSPPNVYNSLQAREHDVTSATGTSTAPSCDVSQADAPSYYNVRGQAQSDVSGYYNV